MRLRVVVLVLAAMMANASVSAQGDGKTGKVFETVERMPEFPGGPSALFDFISTNVKYPEDAVRQRIEGRVISRFVIDTLGRVRNVEVVKSVCPSVDAEAVRVIKMLPEWKPGRHKGRKVNVRYTIPVMFRLGSKASKTR